MLELDIRNIELIGDTFTATLPLLKAPRKIRLSNPISYRHIDFTFSHEEDDAFHYISARNLTRLVIKKS